MSKLAEDSPEDTDGWNGMLVTGESDTGQALVPRAIHAQSPQRQHPFVAINRGAIPQTLIADPFNLERSLEEFEKSVVMDAFDQAHSVQAQDAELLGVNYRSPRHRLRKYRLSGMSEGTATT